MPEPSSVGGMKAIAKMYYDNNIFNQSDYIHFDSTFAGTSKISRLIQSVFLRFRFIFLLIKTKPAGVFIYTSSYWGFYDKAFYAFLTNLFGSRSALNLVGGEFFKFYNSHFYHKWMVKFFMKFPNKIVIGSTSWIDEFKQEFPNVKFEIIHNPVVWQNDFDKPKLKSNEVRFLFFGRLAIEKGIEEIIQALKQIQMYPELKFHFTFAGKGPLGNHIRSALGDMIKLGKVSVYENVSDLEKNKILHTSHVFVLPSHAEVLPISLLEAMGFHMPAIITNVGGMKDAVDENASGIIIDYSNETVNELVKSLLFFINNHEQIEKMGKIANLKIKEQFEFNIIFHKKVKLFH